MQGDQGTIVWKKQRRRARLPPFLTMSKATLEKKIKTIEDCLSSVRSCVDKFISEYADVSYSYISSQISQCAREIQSLKKERVKIGEDMLHKLNIELGVRRAEIHKLRIEVALLMGDIFLPRISLIERLEKELIEPWVSGIQRAKAGLKELYGLHDKYESLYALHFALLDNLLRMQKDALILSRNNPAWKSRLSPHKEQLLLSHGSFMSELHLYRFAYRRKIIYHHQGSWPLPLLMNEVDRLVLKYGMWKRIGH